MVCVVLLSLFTSGTNVTVHSCSPQIARKNVKHYREPRKTGTATPKDAEDSTKGAGAANFPGNVSFVHVSGLVIQAHRVDCTL